MNNEDILKQAQQRESEQAAAANRNEAKIRLLLFRLGEEWFALEAQQVREISRLGKITRVPLTPPHIMGVLNLRGQITAVVDVRPALNLPQAPLEESARVIVARHESIEAGILAEAVVEMLEVPRSSLSDPSHAGDAEHGKYASAIVTRKLGNQSKEDNQPKPEAQRDGQKEDQNKDKDSIIVVLKLATLLDALKVR